MIGFSISLLFSVQLFAAQVNVYSGRQEALIKPLLEKFTQETGIEVNLVAGKADALLSRIKAEGQFTPADLVILADIGRLVRAKQMGITQTIGASVLSYVDPQWQDKQGHWLALTKRARPIMVKKDFDVSKITGLQDLTKAEFLDDVCIRSSSNIYNQSMISALIVKKGETHTLEWAKGLVKNFARTPKGGDRDQIKAMVAGECEVAIANTYYLGGMLTAKDETTRKVAQQVQVIWPDQGENGMGTHINVSGAALVAGAKNKSNAEKLLAFMLTEQSQQWYAQVNHEYPIIDGVAWSPELSALGQFKAQSVPLDEVGANNAKALLLMDKAGWK